MKLSEEAFDADAVFLADVVDDDVLPKANLAVDGLTTGSREDLEMRPEDVAVAESSQPDNVIPVITTQPNELEVYGYETSLWKKIRDYIGF